MIDLNKPSWRWFFGLPVKENETRLKCHHFRTIKKMICLLFGHNFNYGYGSHRIGQWSICKRCLFRKEFKKVIHKIGEHGAVGYLTRQGRFCAECGEKIKDTNLK